MAGNQDTGNGAGGEDIAAELNAKIAALEASEVRERELTERVEALETETAALKRQLSSQRGATTRAKAEAREARGKGALRKLGAPPSKRGAEPLAELTAAQLLELIDDADDVEIVASDGRSELDGVPGFGVSEGGLVERRGQLVLEVPSMRITGPNTGAAQRTIAGFALVVDGEQVAWSQLPDPIPLGAGQEYELKDSVVFGSPSVA